MAGEIPMVSIQIIFSIFSSLFLIFRDKIEQLVLKGQEKDETDEFMLNKIKTFEKKIEEMALDMRNKDLKLLAFQNDMETVNLIFFVTFRKSILTNSRITKNL